MIKKLLLFLFLLSSLVYASLEQQITTISNLSTNSATIDIANLTPGQTGVIIHNFDESKSIIIADFEVTSSSPQNSNISISYKVFENAQAIPTPNIKVQNGDKAILNHMYNTSILIAPNFEVYNLVQNNFKQQNFIHSDILAAYLKSEQEPVPALKDFKKFCEINNIGTLFFAIEDHIYIVDAKTFIIIEEYKIKVETSDENMTPFYTNVEDIKLGIFNFGASSIENYNNYYLQLLGL